MCIRDRYQRRVRGRQLRKMATAEQRLQVLQDALEHERMARAHEQIQHAKVREYAGMQLFKSIDTPAAYHDCEKALLANEYNHVMERCVRQGAADLALNRLVDPIGSSVERQILARQIQNGTLANPQTVNRPQGGYLPASFVKGSPNVAAEAEAAGYGSWSTRATERQIGATAANHRSQHLAAFEREVACSQIKQTYSFGRR
eukprot:TRINITY_DN776_c0_g1_i1.p1 TRINITY_DN776_c0_g1~~TRINITY_DN776_c0_g1_i1.p1  ORF type:complete len:202 (-),score=40.84 TRINITY_DN776_c0_g1_i1:338-943(-)